MLYAKFCQKRLCFIALLVYALFEFHSKFTQYMRQEQYDYRYPDMWDYRYYDFDDYWIEYDNWENEAEDFVIYRVREEVQRYDRAIAFCLEFGRNLPVFHKRVHLMQFKNWLLNFTEYRILPNSGCH